MKVLDTTVAVDHLRGEPKATKLMERLVRSGESIIASEVVRFELMAGVRRNEIEALEKFCTALYWVPVTEGVTRRAGAFAREYRASHKGIDVADYLIAATATVLDAEVLTTNVRHFPMLPGLRSAY